MCNVDGIGLSLAQLLMGRRLRTKLPTSLALLTSDAMKKVQRKLKELQGQLIVYNDRQTKFYWICNLERRSKIHTSHYSSKFCLCVKKVQSVA